MKNMRKNVFVIAGLMLANVFVACQKDDIQDDIASSNQLTSVTVGQCSTCKSADDTLTVSINGVASTATFNGNETYETNAAGAEVNASRQYVLGTNKFGFQNITLNLQGNSDGPESGYITLSTGTDVVVVVANGPLTVDFTTATVVLSHGGSGTVTVDDLGIAPSTGIIDPFNFEAVFNILD